ncbi:MAG: DUF362 domain-containing protein [Synergistaceae bacterium]|jgi:uncharacterized protein (DUF362 family)|nr:DUF362 domain-containing protein [Synergistaceae bacterium]
MSIVSIVKTSGDDERSVAAAVREAIREIGGIDDIVKPGYTVIVKPNFVAVPSERLSGAVTRWEAAKAVADLVRERGAEPIIAESSAAGVDTEKVIEKTEYDLLRKQGYKVVDLKQTPPVTVSVPAGWKVFGEMKTWEPVKKADAIISVPVLKTHDQTEVTLGLKNIKGLISDAHKKDFHRYGVLEGVVDLITTFRPVLTVIDGTWGQEGLGPIFGTPVPMGLIVASKDMVAADAVGGRIMGYDPKDVPITVRAAARGLGEMDLSKIEIRGVPVSQVERRFLRASETKIEGLPPFDLLMDEGACTGCRNTVISAIMDMKSQNLESNLKGKCIVCGPLDESKLPPDVPKDRVVLVGICTRQLEKRGTFVPGCPPNNVYVVRGVVGEEVANRY